MAICTIDGCDRSVYRNGLCRRHEYRRQTHGDPLGGGPLRDTEHRVTCCMPGCDKPYLARGLCATHYARRRAHGDPLYQPMFAKNQVCVVRGCKQFQVAHGYCGKHYQRYTKHGDPEKSLIAVAGSGSISSKGYRIVYRPDHPGANAYGRMSEHRLIMSEMIGRPLRAEEVVHHRNGNRLDNRPENLELWVKAQPCGQRYQDLLKWAREIIATYEPLEHNVYFQQPDTDSSSD